MDKLARQGYSESTILLFLLLLLPAAGFGQSTLIFPKFFSPEELPNSGFAIVNPGPAAASVTFTLYSATGTVVSTTMQTLEPRTQSARTGAQVFPIGGSGGWVQVTSPTTGLQGLWLNYSSGLTYVDGAEAAVAAVNETIPLVAGSTEVHIANPNSTSTTAVIQLLGSNGTQLAAQVMETIPAHGVFHSDAFTLFGLPVQTQTCYVRVLSGSTNTLAVTAVVRNYLVPVEDGVVNGVDESSTTTQLNFPHVISGPLAAANYSTLVGLTNLSNATQPVTITYFSPNGLRSTPVHLQLAARGSLRDTVQHLFNLPVDALENGWIQATGSAPITGFAAYAELAGGAFTVVPVKSSGSTSLLFPQIANLPPWQTGIALLNPGTTPANVRISAMTAEGTLIGGATTDPSTAVLTLASGAKASLSLSEMIPEAGVKSAAHPADGGFVFVQSENNVPIYGIELFYNSDLATLSNVAAGTLATGISYTPPAPVAVAIQSLTLSSTSVATGETATGSVVLSAGAPSGGAVVRISSGSSASVPATVTVPAGSASATFTVSTGTVSSNQTATITASYRESSAQVSLTVTPATLAPAANAPHDSDSIKDEVGDLAGSRWDGSIDWTEKGHIQGRVVDVPYKVNVTFKFSDDGTCTNGKGQPCKWEKKGQTITVSVTQTKKECPGSGSLTLDGNVMSGTWEHYGGFTCFHIPPPRSIKLKRHK